MRSVKGILYWNLILFSNLLFFPRDFKGKNLSTARMNANWLRIFYWSEFHMWNFVRNIAFFPLFVYLYLSWVKTIEDLRFNENIWYLFHFTELMFPYEIVTIESFRGPFPIVIVINSIVKIEMGILFFQIGFIDEGKHALALSSKKIRRRKKI